MEKDQLVRRSIVVTGGGSGIGRACARQAAAEGAAVLVADLDPGRAGAVAAEIAASGGQAEAFEIDVTDPQQCEAMADRAAEVFGAVDALIAAAGISAAPQAGDPVAHDGASAGLSWSTDVWDRVLNVNLNGLMYSNRAVARHMIAAENGGSIVNIASISSTWTSGNATAYSVSKAGAWMLTKALAVEFARHGIRVNAVGPGFTETPMTADTRADVDAQRSIIDRTPLGRFARPAEIADSALFLAGEKSSFITGSIIYVDGGFNAYSR